LLLYFLAGYSLCLPLLWLCRPFYFFERCLYSKPQSCRSQQARYKLGHTSPFSQPLSSCSHPPISLRLFSTSRYLGPT
jgi:hypothetical protein